MRKNSLLAYQKNKEELLKREQREKLKGQSIKSIKSWSDTSGTTTIIIETEKYSVTLKATDLGAWFEKISPHH